MGRGWRTAGWRRWSTIRHIVIVRDLLDLTLGTNWDLFPLNVDPRSTVDVLVPRVVLRAESTVDIEPPVTDKDLLVEQGPVGTEEGVGSVLLANPKHLQRGG